MCGIVVIVKGGALLYEGAVVMYKGIIVIAEDGEGRIHKHTHINIRTQT